MLNYIKTFINLTTEKINYLNQEKDNNDKILCEVFLFGGKQSAAIKNGNIINNQLFINKCILTELQQIKQCVRVINDDYNDLLSQYGSLYFGTDTFYYNECLLQYSSKEIYEIILNHMFHYFLGYTHKITNEIIQQSNILLLFSNVGLLSEHVEYGQSARSKLYTFKKYENVKNEVLIFPINPNLPNYIISNRINNNYMTFIKDSYLDILLKKTIFVKEYGTEIVKYVGDKKYDNKQFTEIKKMDLYIRLKKCNPINLMIKKFLNDKEERGN